MAKRHWVAHWDMGYVGTDGDEEIDLYYVVGKERAEEMSDQEANDYVSNIAYEIACEKISAWAKPDEEKGDDYD